MEASDELCEVHDTDLGETKLKRGNVRLVAASLTPRTVEDMNGSDMLSAHTRRWRVSYRDALPQALMGTHVVE
jgi:hypothetical protein